MDKQRVIASTLTDNELAKAFVDLAAWRWDNWDLTPYLAYLVDVCAPTVLPYLSDQFDVEGLRGFEIAENETQQRELIKRSIALHKYMGTPWALREACRTVGFPVILLEEGVTEPDRIERPEDWARFRLYLKNSETRRVTQEDIRKLWLFIGIYKNERSHLVDLGLYQALSDGPVFTADEEKDEKLDLFTLSLHPNPVIVNPDGAAVTVQVDCNVEWKFGTFSDAWDDESGDRFHIEKSSGEEIIITSDPNETEMRDTLIPILTSDGIFLGHLRVIQHRWWHNAYSSAYCNAYNWLEPYRWHDAYSDGYSSSYDRIDL